MKYDSGAMKKPLKKSAFQLAPDEQDIEDDIDYTPVSPEEKRRIEELIRTINKNRNSE